MGNCCGTPDSIERPAHQPKSDFPVDAPPAPIPKIAFNQSKDQAAIHEPRLDTAFQDIGGL